MFKTLASRLYQVAKLAALTTLAVGAALAFPMVPVAVWGFGLVVVSAATV